MSTSRDINYLQTQKQHKNLCDFGPNFMYHALKKRLRRSKHNDNYCHYVKTKNSTWDDAKEDGIYKRDELHQTVRAHPSMTKRGDRTETSERY